MQMILIYCESLCAKHALVNSGSLCATCVCVQKEFACDEFVSQTFCVQGKFMYNVGPYIRRVYVQGGSM